MGMPISRQPRGSSKGGQFKAADAPDVADDGGLSLAGGAANPGAMAERRRVRGWAPATVVAAASGSFLVPLTPVGWTPVGGFGHVTYVAAATAALAATAVYYARQIRRDTRDRRER